MSVLVIGISHRSAPVDLLEQVALDGDGVAKLISDVAACDHVAETAVLATCNRLEIYADVDRFHGSVEAISTLICERARTTSEQLVPHLYVHYDDGAVSHLFKVAAGLDSMVVGEGQILGQVRDTLRLGQEHGAVGPALNLLFQQALRVGKRAHAETDIDRAAPSLVTAALDRAIVEIGSIRGRDTVIVGAGAMAGLAASTLARLGAGRITVVNRTTANADRLAEEYSALSLPLERLPEVLSGADLVVSCTGAAEVVLDAELVSASRVAATRPLAVIDLALPHDVAPAVGEVPGVTLIGLRRLAEELQDHQASREIAGVRQIVDEEIGVFATARRQASVAPTVVALRSMATGVVDAELERLIGRVPQLDERARAEVEHTLRRVADKLLHKPTIRVKELANEAGAVSYAAALAELFALDPEAVDAVTRPEPTTPTQLRADLLPDLLLGKDGER